MDYHENSDGDGGGDDKDEDGDYNNKTNNGNWGLNMGQELCLETHKNQQESLIIPNLISRQRRSEIVT